MSFLERLYASTKKAAANSTPAASTQKNQQSANTKLVIQHKSTGSQPTSVAVGAPDPTFVMPPPSPTSPTPPSSPPLPPTSPVSDTDDSSIASTTTTTSDVINTIASLVSAIENAVSTDIVTSVASEDQPEEEEHAAAEDDNDDIDAEVTESNENETIDNDTETHDDVIAVSSDHDDNADANDEDVSNNVEDAEAEEEEKDDVAVVNAEEKVDTGTNDNEDDEATDPTPSTTPTNKRKRGHDGVTLAHNTRNLPQTKRHRKNSHRTLESIVTKAAVQRMKFRSGIPRLDGQAIEPLQNMFYSIAEVVVREALVVSQYRDRKILEPSDVAQVAKRRGMSLYLDTDKVGSYSIASEETLRKRTEKQKLKQVHIVHEEEMETETITE